MAKRSTTFRLPDELLHWMQNRAEACGYRSTSEYLETLVRLDRDQDLRVTVVKDRTGTRHFAESLSGKSTKPVVDRVGLMKPKKKKTRRRTT